MSNFAPGAKKVLKWKTTNTPDTCDPESGVRNHLDFRKEVSDCWKRLHWCQSHLNTVMHMTTLMSFFAVTAAVELQIKPEQTSESLIIAYVAVTCLLVGLTVLVMIGSSTILPHIEAVSDLEISRSEVFHSPHDQLFNQISILCLMGQTATPFLFCLDLVLIAWIKFAHFTPEAPMAVTAIIAPVQVIILFFGSVMVKRIWKYRDEHRLYINLGPTRRYSEIAEMWDDNDNDGEDLDSENSLLLTSHRSTTSYGATVGTSDHLEMCKVLMDMH